MSKRRDKGQGYISDKPDKNGRYKGYLTVGYKEDNKPIRKYVTGKTKAEVKKKIRELIDQRNPFSSSDAQTPLADYLRTWLSFKKQELKLKSYKTYSTIIDQHLIPRLGQIPLNQLNPLDTQVIFHDIAENHGARSSNYARSVLLSALNRAVELQLISTNPLKTVRKAKEEKRKQVLWTAKETKRFLKTAKEHRLYALFHLALSTGLRHGELLGLRWTDLKGDMLYIERSVSDLSGVPHISTPKSESGHRVVALSEDSLQILQDHKLRQDEERNYLGESWTETGHIFVSKAGTILLQRSVTRTYKRLQDKADVPKVRLHDLRHMHVSLLINNNIDPRLVADRIGHADPSFTLKTYAHVFKDKRRKAAISLDDLIDNTEEDSSEES